MVKLLNTVAIILSNPLGAKRNTNPHMYLFCICKPRPRCWAAILERGLSLLWAGTEWESCAAGLVWESGAHWTTLASSAAGREMERKKKRTRRKCNQQSWEIVLQYSKAIKGGETICVQSQIVIGCVGYGMTNSPVCVKIDYSQSKLSCSLALLLERLQDL